MRLREDNLSPNRKHYDDTTEKTAGALLMTASVAAPPYRQRVADIPSLKPKRNSVSISTRFYVVPHVPDHPPSPTAHLIQTIEASATAHSFAFSLRVARLPVFSTSLHHLRRGLSCTTSWSSRNLLADMCDWSPLCLSPACSSELLGLCHAFDSTVKVCDVLDGARLVRTSRRGCSLSLTNPLESWRSIIGRCCDAQL